jgi:hypothetical protein
MHVQAHTHTHTVLSMGTSLLVPQEEDYLHSSFTIEEEGNSLCSRTLQHPSERSPLPTTKSSWHVHGRLAGSSDRHSQHPAGNPSGWQHPGQCTDDGWWFCSQQCPSSPISVLGI